jgi:hypothetical protein
MGGAGRARLWGFAGHGGRGYQERGSPVETSRSEQLAVAWVTYDQPEFFEAESMALIDSALPINLPSPFHPQDYCFFSLPRIKTGSTGRPITIISFFAAR